VNSGTLALFYHCFSKCCVFLLYFTELFQIFCVFLAFFCDFSCLLDFDPNSLIA
jgi:hypothetical protein